MTLTRETILKTLVDDLQPRPEVLAMWEAGAAAFDRVDDWSDIDLQIVVEDDQVAGTFTRLVELLTQLSPIRIQYDLPQPTWHGHAQSFILLADTSPFLMLDLCVIKHSSPDKFLTPEIHGQAKFLFDKAGISNLPHLDRGQFQEETARRLPTLRLMFDLFQILTLKEIHRQNWLEALAFYQGYTLRPLVEALSYLYRPAHHHFHTRYVYYELPPQVIARLESFYFVDKAALADRHAEAVAWFNEVFAQLDPQALAARLPASAVPPQD